MILDVFKCNPFQRLSKKELLSCLPGLPRVQPDESREDPLTQDKKITHQDDLKAQLIPNFISSISCVL